MVYRGGLMSEYSTEIFQVKVHQTCIIVLVFLCKETEFVTLVEPRCCSERIYCYKATTSSISMGKYVLHTIKYIAVGTGTWGIAAVIPKYLSLRLQPERFVPLYP